MPNAIAGSQRRNVSQRVSRLSVIVILAAVAQRLYEIWRDSSGTSDPPVSVVAVLPLTVAVLALLHVWRGLFTAHAIALGAITGSCVRYSVRVVSADWVGLQLSSGFDASNFVLLAIVWLTVVVVISALRKAVVTTSTQMSDSE